MTMLARAVELKAELIHFATSGRFERELSGVLDRFYADGPPADEAAAFLPIDYFAHQHLLASGDTVIDRFLRERPDLARAEVELLSSWKHVVEGVFEVRVVDGAAVLLFNLVDELVYRAFSNLGEAAFEKLRPGMYVVGRLVPLGLDWLISGTPAVHPAAARDTLLSVAAHIALEHPDWVFRNPVLLDAGQGAAARAAPMLHRPLRGRPGRAAGRRARRPRCAATWPTSRAGWAAPSPAGRSCPRRMTGPRRWH